MSALPPGPRLPRAVQTAAWITRPAPYLARAQARFGDVFTIRIGGEPPWVMLAHPDAVKEVFTGDPAVMHAGKANLVLRPLVGLAAEHVAGWPRGAVVPLAPRMQAITLDVVLRVIFGVEERSERLAPLRGRLRDMLGRGFSGGAMLALAGGGPRQPGGAPPVVR